MLMKRDPRFLGDNKEEYTLQPGGSIYDPTGMRYRLSGKGKACVFTAPAWGSKQNHIVDE
jgi:hypothetical protein